jgi:hypothetical protein
MEIWNSIKISVTLGMYVTCGDNVQRLPTSGPRGWPASQIYWPVDQLLSRFRPKLLRHVST